MKYIIPTCIILSFALFHHQTQLPENTRTKNSVDFQKEQNLHQLQAAIDSLLTSKFNNGKLNGNVLVVEKGKEVFKKSFGFADAAKKQKLNEDFRFNIGSVYKEFPAVAIMQLEEAGELNLQNKLNQYINGLPNWADSISIKHLLQYSSGLPTINWGEHFSKGIVVTNEMILEDLRDIKQLEFPSGTDYLYSNYSPILLVEIVEKITSQDFKNYAQEKLLDPFKLNQSIFKEQYPYKDKTLMAIPFNENYEVDTYKISMPLVLFSSTVSDMNKWFQHLDSFDIISEKSVRFLSEEAKTRNNIQAPLGRSEWGNGKIVEHSHHGSSASYECVVRRFKQKDLTIVILTNQKHRNVYDISNEILALFN